MARKKLTMDRFKAHQLAEQSQKAIRGGYKFDPSGAGYVGSFIWESIDIRGNEEKGNNHNVRMAPSRRP